MRCVAVGVGSDTEQSGSNVIISNRIVDTKCAYKLGAGSMYTSSRDVSAGATRSRSSIRDERSFGRVRGEQGGRILTDERMSTLSKIRVTQRSASRMPAVGIRHTRSNGRY